MTELFDSAVLEREAVDRTGLDDFGTGSWREAMLRLIEASESEARLNDAGGTDTCSAVDGGTVTDTPSSTAGSRTDACESRIATVWAKLALATFLDLPWAAIGAMTTSCTASAGRSMACIVARTCAGETGVAAA